MRHAWTLVILLAAAACGSSAAATRAPEPRDEPERTPDASRVSISPEVNAQLEAWMAADATVIADVIEIDATRIPFASQIAAEASTETDLDGRRIVERVESVDPATGIASLTITNRSGIKTTIETMPRVRLGGGRQFIATDRLVVRYVPVRGVDHPVSISIVATGKARLVETEPARRVAGSAILLRADILRDGGAGGARGYEFHSAEERRP